MSKDGDQTPLELVDIQKILDDVLVLCSEKFKNHSVKLEVNPLSLSIECKPVQIGQILLNALNNAYEATSRVSDKWIAIDLKVVSENLEIRIRDSGLPIDPQIASQIGQPFFTTKKGGTGLGVRISRKIANEHNGQFELSLEPGPTCFCLILPLRQPPPHAGVAA